jgi:type IV secretory pathway ATPase VirB11/archaellum biosynthesis ATPase
MDNASAAETNLRWLLRPIDGLLTDPAMTDLYINGPGEGQCFVERGHGVERITLPYTFDDLEDLAINAAALTRQDIAEDVPLVSTRFPDGHRVQIVRPPAIADNQFAFSIRQPRRETWTPSDLARGGGCSPAPPDRIVCRRRGVSACSPFIKPGRGKRFSNSR